MIDATQATELLAAAGTAGAAMDETRQRRTMSGGLLGAVAVYDQYAPVIRRDAEAHRIGDRSIIGEQRGNQAAFAAPDQLDRLIEIVIGHNRRDRAERFGIV